MLLSAKQDWLGNIRGDILAGIVVALALVPEAIAFSIIAGVDPKVGLYPNYLKMQISELSTKVRARRNVKAQKICSSAIAPALLY